MGFTFIAFIGLAIVFALSSITIRGYNAKSLLTVVPLILTAVIYCFPIFYLWKFSRLSKQAIENNDTSALSKALKYLKLHYRFMAMLIVILIVGYSIAGIAMLISGRFYAACLSPAIFIFNH